MSKESSTVPITLPELNQLEDLLNKMATITAKSYFELKSAISHERIRITHEQHLLNKSKVDGSSKGQ